MLDTILSTMLGTVSGTGVQEEPSACRPCWGLQRKAQMLTEPPTPRSSYWSSSEGRGEIQVLVGSRWRRHRASVTRKPSRWGLSDGCVRRPRPRKGSPSLATEGPGGRSGSSLAEAGPRVQGRKSGNQRTRSWDLGASSGRPGARAGRVGVRVPPHRNRKK